MKIESVYFNEEHAAFRESLRKFVEKELRPHADEWEETGLFPTELFRTFGKLGYLGLRFPEEFGGQGLDYWYTVILCEELVRCHSLGVGVGLLVQTEMATSVIDKYGTPEQKRAFLTPAIAGEKIAALGITEPGHGSNVAGIRTTARRVGDEWVINGSKTFISNGTRANFITLAARTGGEGARGVSVILVPTDAKGFTVGRTLKKMGTHSSDLAELFFEDVRVPVGNLVGEDGRGFAYVMELFQGERLVLASFANGIMQVLLEEAMNYGKARQVFGQPIVQHQYWRHRLAETLTQMQAARELTYFACDRLNRGLSAQKEVSMAKLYACDLVKRVAETVLQLHGGYGYMEEYPVCRFYRDVAAFGIGAGTSEVMREIIAKEAIDQ
ncbi:citronellyl-CoA dehydrogenase [Anaerolineae bacterium]|nr:citronellyl-CoA dehydrogenase [Anaerolineae bacterium]